MKLIETMKDEKLGSAILYNFTKGYGKAVPMNLYNVVLPLLFNDLFRTELSKNDNIKTCIEACVKLDDNFKKTINADIDEMETMTSKALGISLLNKDLEFKIMDGMMKGICGNSEILELNEAILLGVFLQGKDYEKTLSLFKAADLDIVFLDSDTLGTGVDLSKFEKFGRVTVLNNTNDKDVVEAIRFANVIITNKKVLGKVQLEAASSLKLICVTATGINNIDLDYCHEKDIAVCNVKGYSTDSVAQHTFALLLDLYNKNHYYHDYVATGNYSSSSLFTHLGYSFNELANKTWGIVGMGDIGRKVAKIAEAFGCVVQYYSTSGKNNNQAYQQVSLEVLLKTSDIISIHAPLNEKTDNLFNLKAFSLMKTSAYLINVGRGKIVNEKDLVVALNNNCLAGAGLDVFENEPFYQDSMLLRVNNPSKLLMTPHIAWAASEARNRVVDEVCLNISGFINGTKRNIC